MMQALATKIVTKEISPLLFSVANISASVSESDATFVQVIGSYLDSHAVTRRDFDEVLPHLAGYMGKDLVAVGQLNLIHGCRQDFRNHAIHLNQIRLTFCHRVS
jgi:hypothetical protein